MRLTLITLISGALAGVWTYENGDPRRWQKACKTGKIQSPINFQNKQMQKQPPLKPNWGSKLSGEFINNGHTIQVNTKSDFTLKDSQGTDYKLLQFHFHIPSEHHRYSRSFDSEIHFVHKNDQDQYAVFGIWLRLAKESNPFIASLVSNGIPKKGDKLPVDVDFSWLTRQVKRAKKHWSYKGSLTTPPCTEDILWTIADAAYPISVEDYNTIHDAMPFNARPTQPQPQGAQVDKDEDYDDDQYSYYVPPSEYQNYDFHDHFVESD